MSTTETRWQWVRGVLGGELPSRFLALADIEGADAEQKLKNRFLILAGTMMSGGGILWGSIAAGAGLYFESLAPFGYVVVTLVNFSALALWKNFSVARNVQVSASILLPFAFQWVLGGFGASGGMMYWGMVGVIGSLSFDDVNKSARWLAAFACLTAISAAAEGLSLLTVPPSLKDDELSALFFGLNFVTVSSIVFALTLFFVRSRHEATRDLEAKNEELAVSKAEAEAASRRADAANAARGRFLAVVSHEMRTPLNGILGLTNLVLDTDLTGRQQEMLRQVIVSAETLLSIINDVLDFSKIEAGGIHLESIPFRLDDVLYRLSSAATSLAMKRGVEFVLHVEDVPPVLVGDPTRLGQILLNLVSNAVKFTEEGEVVVHLRGEQLVDECVMHVSVRDTGVGIAVPDQARLFEPFQQADDSTTRRFGGTGLGLPICKHFVELMDGELAVESEVGVGSNFSFTARFGFEAETPRAMPKALEGLRTLIVDDNRSAQEVLLGYLGNFGINAEAVDSAELALQKVQGTEYGLVLTDLRMPGMDGIELIRTLREDPAKKDTRLVLVTAVGGKRDREDADAAGADGFLTKPVRSSTLLDHLMELFAPAERASSVEPNERRRAYPGLSGRRVLIVEDNDINREILVAALGGHGIESVIAVDGLEGLRTAQQSHGQLDAILMDLQMPNMDGLEASSRIRLFDPNIPIIGVTADALSDARLLCLEAGMDDVVTKPVHMDLLLATLERLVAGFEEYREETGELASLEERLAANHAEQTSGLGLEVNGLDVADGLARTGGNEKLYTDLLRRFAATHGDAAERIRAALREDRHEEAERVAHTLKGVAGNIGATDVFDVASNFRRVIASADEREMDALLDRLAELLDRLVHDLNDVVAPEAGTTSFDEANLGRFRALVIDSDPEAAELSRTLRSHIAERWGEEVSVGLHDALETYDFARAQMLLTELDEDDA